MKKVYLSRKSYVRFDDDHFLLYIGEQKVENYHPETSGTSDTKSEASGQVKPPSVTKVMKPMVLPRLRQSLLLTVISRQVWYEPNTARIR